MKISRLMAVGVALLALSQARAVEVEVGRDGYLFIKEEFFELSHEGVLSTTAALKKTDDLLESLGIKVIFAVVPTKISIFPEKVMPTSPANTGYLNRYADIYSTMTAAGLTTAQVRTDILLLKSQPTRDIWLKRDTHWTPSTAYAVGQAIARKITASGWLKGTETTNVSVQWTEISYPTDLSRFYVDLNPGAPMLRNEVILAPEMTTEELGLLDDFRPSVVLVGSSYSMLPRPALHIGLSEGLHTPVLNFGMDGGGVWGGLLNYLRSDAFKTAPAKVMVWEIPERIFGQNQPVDGLQPLLDLIKR